MKNLIKKTEEWFMSKKTQIVLLIIWIILIISGIFMKLGINIPILSEILLFGKPMNNNFILLWLAVVSYSNIFNLKQINKKR